MTDFKRRLKRGEFVSLINADYACPGLVEFLGGLGIDAVMLDCEQGNPSFTDVEDMRRAAHLRQLPCLVRVPSAEPWTIERYMMRGVDGIVIPRLNTPEEVARAVSDVHYAAPDRIAQTTIIVQIESIAAVQALDEFLAVPDVDCWFIGPVDLSKSMGCGGDYAQAPVMRVIEDTISKIRQADAPVGLLVKPHDLSDWQAKGVSLLYAHVNDFLQLGAQRWRVLADLKD